MLCHHIFTKYGDDSLNESFFVKWNIVQKRKKKKEELPVAIILRYDFLSKLSVIKSSFCGDIYGSFHLDMGFFSYSFSRMKYSYNEAKIFLRI